MTDKTTKAVSGARKEQKQHGRAKPVMMNEGVAFLIESELERAEVVLAAKGITTKLQDMAENLSKVEANDIMPLLDSFRETFGPQAADQFSQISTQQIRELIGAIQTSKSAIDNEISRLETMVNGGDGSDAGMGLPEAPPAPPAPVLPGGPDEGLPPDDGLPPGDEGLPPDMPEEDPALGSAGFAGRPKKESAVKKGKRLTEFLAVTGNAVESGDFKANMDKLAAMSPKCFTFAHDIADSIHALSVSGDIRNKLVNALGHVVAMASSEEVWEDPEAVADLGISTHFVDGPLAAVVKEPEVNGIVKNLRKLAHLVALKHSGDLNEDDMHAPTATLPAPAAAAPVAPAPSPLAAPPRVTPSILTAGRVYESRRTRAIKRLSETHDPDKLILTVFRNVFRECQDVVSAVTGTARAFGIDAGDVVAIIREAKAKVVKEDVVPALMGVPMGKPNPNENPALMSQNVTAANPVPGQPNKPMTPADMRTVAQDKANAATGMPNPPLVPAKQMAPVQQVNGQQQVQPVLTPQMQQQQRANKLPKVPGKLVNNSNVRTVGEARKQK